MRSTTELSSLVMQARRVSLPLLGVTTADPADTMRLIINGSKDVLPAAPAVAWDSAAGLYGCNDLGTKFLASLGAAGTLQAADALSIMQRLPENSLGFILNAHRWIEREDVAQAVWNLRDPFKGDGRMLVMLAPYLQLPVELSQDVMVVDEPLPGETQLREILITTYKNAEVDVPEEDTLERCIHACRGMSAFAAEQALALSLKRTGMNLPSLWERTKHAVEQTRGLSFTLGGPGFDSLGGLDHAKQLGAGLFNGPLPPRCVVRIDEIEKQFAGTSGDMSGIAQDFSGVMLRAIQDYSWSGLIAVGPPGSGKSAFSKCLGAQYQVPTLEIDLGAAKGSLVGESEAAIRQIMKVIHALAGERGAFFLGTCNSITSLPPELRRRFGYGAWMFDLPSKDEREPIWRMYLERFGLPAQSILSLPEDDLWTGADIYNCCELAYRLDVSLVEASEHLLPVAKSAPEQIRVLRELADGRFLSASYPGAYRKPDDAITPAPATGRRIDLN